MSKITLIPPSNGYLLHLCRYYVTRREINMQSCIESCQRPTQAIIHEHCNRNYFQHIQGMTS
ncbi:hypothetical protein PUN28_011031 [Cardiocondyla obscurior]|uniref:Uncharacterized protein n=1 Tax=Cardiocondyla obscurior TaxID=286306 RepID=A0AAW2FLA0_9HYME